MKAINISRFICDFLAFIRDFLFTIENELNELLYGRRQVLFWVTRLFSKVLCFSCLFAIFLFTFENELNELLYGRKQVGERERYINIDTFLEKMTRWLLSYLLSTGSRTFLDTKFYLDLEWNAWPVS